LFRGRERENLFELPDVTVQIDEAGLLPLMEKGATVSGLLYNPQTLTSRFAPWPHRVSGVTFRRVSFNQTVMQSFEFVDCAFERCLFVGTIFRKCRFSSCRFLDCNFYRSEFSECFVNPSQFDRCLPRRGYENVGLHLFQELLHNSRQQSQPDFADEAQCRFRRWQRYQLRAEMIGSRDPIKIAKRLPSFLWRLLFDLAAGSGMRLRRILLSCLLVLLSTTFANWRLAAEMGLQQDKHVISSFGDAFYVTTVIMTTLGFGDITPLTLAGRLAVSCEALVGFMLFAFLTSTLYRKLSS
jgi:hypothetical protein